MTKDQIISQITPILKDAGMLRAALFGAIVCGELRPDSDIDILVELARASRCSISSA